MDKAVLVFEIVRDYKNPLRPRRGFLAASDLHRARIRGFKGMNFTNQTVTGTGTGRILLRGSDGRRTKGRGKTIVSNISNISKEFAVRNNVCFWVRLLLDKRTIIILLIRAGVERNPGPNRIVTINCRGLTNNLKLLSTLGKLKKRFKEKAIILLQETHWLNDNILNDTWGENMYALSNGSRNSRGVAILVTKDLKVEGYSSDDDGRLIFASIVDTNDDHFLIVNLYAPNDWISSKQFFVNMFEGMDRFRLQYDHEMVAIGGDFNFVF